MTDYLGKRSSPALVGVASHRIEGKRREGETDGVKENKGCEGVDVVGVSGSKCVVLVQVGETLELCLAHLAHREVQDVQLDAQLFLAFIEGSLECLYTHLKRS